ncbi:F-box only protein 36 [Lingula anatina]|uniref:F-box only protein 36 n=1 Tax=Lingula anatina TaxID=7574 RepID=A0A1S3JUJ7_LINAN|nr:F-box only protein 36 [Lingula anatina]|eukprot:XP_013414045.1 F-box only protein 36 [Lingula anatina]
MASLLRHDGIILDYSDTAPAPSKDFCQILIDHWQVIFRWWKISPRNEGKKAPPGEIKESYDDFLHDDRTQSEVHRVFGVHFLEYVKRIAEGHIDYFPRMPPEHIIRILSYLELEDLARVAQVSKQFRELCNSNELWEKIYRANSETPITPQLQQLANEQGWKKLFFTNKLQLQVQLRRQSRKRRPQHDDHPSFVTEPAFMTTDDSNDMTE